MRAIRALVFAGLLLGAMTVSDTAHGVTTSPLFFIARNKNANIVQYDALLTSAGAIDASNPVTAYWVMHAEDGRREPLSRLEREVAYGFTTRTDDSGSIWMVLTAHKNRPIRVLRDGGGVRAEMNIAGRRATLTKIFVQAKEGVVPRVEYVDLFGRDVRTGAPLQERKMP